MSAIPPSARENRIAATTDRVHRMRVARGACWVIVTVLVVGAFLSLLDAIVWLPPWVRGIGLAAWVTGIGVLVWRLVARRIPPDANTTLQDARRELPGNLRAAAAAAFVLAAALVATAWVPGASEHFRRVALPWSGKIAPPNFRLKVTSGAPVVRRGDSVTLSAYGERIDPAAAAPESATLVCREPNGAELRIPMHQDAGGAFHATRGAVLRPFEYRVEVGPASSDWYSVAVLDPVELTAQSAMIVIPPRYAPEARRQMKPGFVSFQAHQHADVELQLHFSRPASTAFLEWRASGGAAVELIPVSLTPEHRSGTARFRLTRDGDLMLVLVAEESGKTLRTVSTAHISVESDAPPRFDRMIGVATRPRTARPGARIAIEFTAIDDLAIGAATLEYAVGSDDSKMVRLPIRLDRAGSTRADGHIEFILPAQEGDTIRFRVRVKDTRRLEDPELLPQEAIFPKSGWSVLRIDSAAAPLVEQDVLAQRDALGDVLMNALDELKKTQNEIGTLRTTTADRTSLRLDESIRLSNIRGSTRRLGDSIRGVAGEASLTPDLRLLAEAVGEIAEQPLKSADGALQRCATDNPADRRAAFTAVIELLGDAIARIDRHLSFNSRIAQARLDSLWIASLAAEQAALANRALNEDAKPEELARLESDLLARLETLVGRSPPLQDARAIAKDRQILGDLAASRKLAEHLRELDAAIRKLNLQARKDLLSAAANEQEVIVAAATVLTRTGDVAARLAGVSLPAVTLFTHIAELIESGKTVEALTELEARAQALEAIAAAVEKWSSEDRDPRIAARHLALWQDDMRSRFRIATKQHALRFDVLPPTAQEAFRREQRAIRTAIIGLKLPPSNQNKKDELAQRAAFAVDSLAGKGASTDGAMRTVVDDLNRLADDIPTIPERLTKARRDFQKLFQSQDAIQAAVEQAIRGNETAKRLPALADSQIYQMKLLLGFDIPGSESRASSIHAALSAAASDLRQGLPFEALASQHWLRRELDRQRLVLEGIAAPDDRAEELARKLRSIAASVASLGPRPTSRQLEAPAAAAQEIAQQIALFASPPEAAALANDARNAAQLLESAARTALQKPDDFRQRLQAAAIAMAKLADRMNGEEPDFDRVRRLSAYRWAAWEEARKTLGKPPNADVSAEASRELVREAEELTFTRVGFAGQSLKKRILDQYTRLRILANPDRMAGLQKTLAESLDELAALMADVPELATPIPRVQSDPKMTDADNYRPTAALAAKFRELAEQQRALRHRISSISEQVRKLTLPADTNPLAKVSESQRQLAETIEDFSRKLFAEKTSAAKAAGEAATSARLAANQLAVGMWASANEAAMHTARLLREAASMDALVAKAATDLAARQDAIRESMEAKPPAPAAVAAQQQARGVELARRAGDLARDFLDAAAANASRESIQVALDQSADEIAAVEKLIADATQKAGEGMPQEASKLHGEAIQRLVASAKKAAALLPRPPTLMETEPTAFRSASMLQRAETAMRRSVEGLNAKSDRKAAEKAMRLAADALTTAAKARLELIGR